YTILKLITSARADSVMSLQSQSMVHESLPKTNPADHTAPVPVLLEKILSRDEGILSQTRAMMATTGASTGRSPIDRFVVKDEETADKVDWGSVNQPIDEDKFDKLYQKVISHLSEQDELFSFKGFAGADESYRLPVEVINEYAWHNLFARQL